MALGYDPERMHQACWRGAYHKNPEKGQDALERMPASHPNASSTPAHHEEVLVLLLSWLASHFNACN
jgi:hypothetical protein